MTTQLDYAVLSAIVYNDVRPDSNKFTTLPTGWTEILSDSTPGFTASAFQNGNDIVIAYKGTDSGLVNGAADWLMGNIPAGFGVGSTQLVQASEFYAAIRTAYPDANITFTGHSLGGGIASVMAVWFNRPATTFDEAPFALSALNPIFTSIVAARLFVQGFTDPSFTTYLGSGPVAFAQRLSNVNDYFVTGEVLEILRAKWPTIVFTDTPIAVGGADQLPGSAFDNAVTLHSINLAAALMMQDKLRADTVALPGLLAEIFDKQLYARDLNLPQRDFLTHLLNNQIRVGYTDANGLLAKFAADIDKLTTLGDNLKTGALSKAVIDAAIADYYLMQNGFSGKDFFTAITGGIEFNLADLGTNWQNNKTVTQLSNTIINQLLNGDFFARAILTQDNAWTIQSGTDALTANGTGSNNDAMIGGTTDDTLNGGNGNDSLFGGVGTDTLIGGVGDDLLVGGTGVDTLDGGAGVDYYIVEGYDTIRDSDGLGLIKDSAGNIISGAIKHNADGSYTFMSATGISVTRDTNLTLTLADGTVAIIENFTSGDLGLQISDATTTPLIFGTDDPLYAAADTLNSNVACEMRAGLGNDILTASAQADLLHGEDGHDAMFGRDGNDELHGGFGNDLVNGGLGDDLLYGEEGHDLMVGSSGNDILYGAEGKDFLFGGATFGSSRIIQRTDDPNYLTLNAINTPNFAGFVNIVDGQTVPELEGSYFVGDTGNNLLDGGAGDDNLWGDSGTDTLLGGTGVDHLYGFAGSDVAIGGEGNDILHGDVTQGDLSQVDQFGQTSSVYALSEFHGDDSLDGGVGDDTLVGDGGNDLLLGGDGNDQLFGDSSKLASQWHGDDTLLGGAGDDTLAGNGGDDTVAGGTGTDQIWGGDGNDILEGGDGNDILYGDNGDGGTGDDTLVGGADNDTLWGEGGNDTLIGDAGDDKLYGAQGANYLDGGDGVDLLNSGGPGSSLFGGAGNDDLQAAGGNNYLDGEDGNDKLVAVDGHNSLFGGAGNDDLQAAGGNNSLDGEAGNNTLFADGGGNTLFAGTGDDTLAAQGGNNYLDGGDGFNRIVANGAGGNTLIGGANNDTLSAEGGNNYLSAGDGSNTLIATGGGNSLYSGSGNDSLQATGGNNYLDGGDGADTLLADGGNNELYGGAGADTLRAYGGNNLLDGGEGRDQYVFDVGFGVNHISDSGSASAGSGQTGGNTLRFNFSFAGSGIVVGLGSLKLSFATGDELHIDNYDPNDPTGTCSIDTFEFNDGTTTTILSLQDILDIGGPAVDFTRGVDINGTAGADTLLGTDRAEHIYGLAGNDTIDAGARNDYIEGGAGNDTIDGGAGADTMKGGGWDDVYVVDDVGDVVSENVNEGWDKVQSSVSYTLGSHVEELVLTGPSTGSGQALLNIDGTGNALDNYIIGNDGNNILTGNAGADNLYGGAGNDTLSGGEGDDTLWSGAGADMMAGGAGNDAYVVDDSGDVVSENLNEGTDSVHSSVTYTLGGNLENLNLSDAEPGSGQSLNIDGTGNALDNLIAGNSGNNVLRGGAGNDVLAGAVGADTMIGGTGNDVYSVDDVGDAIVENIGEGTDTVGSSIDFILSANVENLNLTGTGSIGTGNALDNIIAGNNSNNNDRIDYVLLGGAGNDTLTGNNFNDTLDGGSGADSMSAGRGNDTYLVDNAGDRIIENVGGGVDTVQSAIPFTLGYQLENLTLIGTANINGTGNEFSNIIIGNSGNNTLTDPSWGDDIIDGGTGADIMSGGYFNDTYYVDNAGDQVVETYAGYWGGNDIVYSSVTFTLGANVENLILTGADNIDGTGNALTNVITGNDGVNVLSGGAGDDTYHVQTAGDTVIEAAGNGYDQVYTDVDFTLSGNTEFLSLNDGALVGIGDESGNDIEGNLANNLLEGRAGDDYLNGYAGNDTLSGGDGNDTIYGGYDSFYQDDNGWGLLSNSDVLDGGVGDDSIDGGSGNDAITGGIGNDTLFGGDDDGSEGADPLSNTDVIDGGEGNDSIDGGSGADILHGGIGDDYLYGGSDGRKGYFFDYATQSYMLASSDDILSGEEGNDFLDGGSGADSLLGGVGDDTIYGGDNSWDSYLYDPVTDTYIAMSNDDYLDGGAGVDVLIGGQGDDIYVVDGSYVRAADVPVVNDCGDPALAEQLVWTTDTVTEYAEGGYDIVMSSVSYTLTDNVEELRLTFAPAMAASDSQRYADLQAFGQDGAGNTLDNMLVGNELNNRLEGDLGNDTLAGGDGNDTLIGGQGDDMLSGGSGDDRFVFRLGDGADTVADGQGSDTLYIGNDLTATDIAMQRVGDDLLISINNTIDSVTLVNWFTQPEGVRRIEFCDGSVLVDLFNQAQNAAPIAIQDLVAINEESAQTAIAAADLLANDTDPDAGDTLALSGFDATTVLGNTVTQDTNGNLMLDIGDRYQSLGSGQTANDNITYTVSDAAGATSTATVDIAIAGVNDAPVVATLIAGQQINENVLFSFTVPVGNFTDIDNGDVLTYSVTLSDGSPLPGWLSFDAATGTFSGTPTNGDVGNLNVLVTATDTGGLSASSTFSLNVANVNDAPTANADTGTATEDGGAMLLDAATLLANDTDPDFIHGDVLNIVGVSQAASGAAVSLLNGAVQYEAGALFQSLGQGQAATDTFSYTVSDTAGATGAATVTMTVTGVNDEPVTADDAASVQEDAALVATGNVLANDTDVDQGAVLSVTNAGTLQGTYGSLVLNADGSYTYAQDNASAAVQGLMAGQSVTEFIAYQSTDGIATTPATLTVTITGTNDAPVAQNDAATVDENSLLMPPSADMLANDTDADIGDSKALVGVDAVSAMGSSISLANGQVVYDHGGRFNSLMAGQSVTDSFSYTMTDSAGSTSTASVSVIVAGVNDGPQANGNNAATNEDTPQITLAADSLLANDTDPDADDALSISGFDGVTTLGNAVSMDATGNLTFDMGNRYQHLAQGETLTDTFGYTITDIAGATSTAQVSVTITGTNDGPVAATDTAAVREDLSLFAMGNVLANDSDVDQGTMLSVSDAGVRAGSYGSLTLATEGGYTYSLDNTSTAVQSLGRTAQVAEHFGYTATDGITGTASLLDVFLNGTNDVPIVVSPLADQYLVSDRHFSWQMPAGSFTDIDQGDTLDYTATMADGSALPEWLLFDAATQTFSGEAPKESGSLDVRITATDKVAANGNADGSLSATDVFRITVSRGNEGVGNGQDAPPPGHEGNFNDGANSSPGHPGGSGGKNHATDSGADSQRHESDRSSGRQAGQSDVHEDDDSRNTDELIRSWFGKESASEQFSSYGALGRSGGRGSQTEWQVNMNVAKGVPGDFSTEWEQMNVRLKKHIEQSGGDEGIFAESGVGTGSFGLYGSQGQQNVSLSSMGCSQQMKFAGLKEGLDRLAA